MCACFHIVQIVHHVFKAFQTLMGVWTHPWSLLYRQDQKEAAEERKLDRGFIDDETSEEEVRTSVDLGMFLSPFEGELPCWYMHFYAFGYFHP